MSRNYDGYENYDYPDERGDYYPEQGYRYQGPEYERDLEYEYGYDPEERERHHRCHHRP